MNNTQFLIDKIKERIPIEVLNLGFLSPPKYNVIPMSLDAIIKRKIIVEKVLRDCNIVGGMETWIDITGCPTEIVQGGMIIRIGFGPTNNRVISSVLSLGFGNVTTIGNAPTIASAVSSPYVMSDANVELIGPNTIYLDGYVGMTFTTAKCILDRDQDFNGIPQRSMLVLADLATYACEGYLYTTLRIKMANGEVVQGVDMGVIKEVVSEYADAYTTYSEILDTRWRVISMFADPLTRRRLISLQTPSS